MTSDQETSLQNKIHILAQLYVDYKGSEEFSDFIEYNDVGLPLSYFLDEGIVQPTVISERFINETFELFLAGLGIEDAGYESLDEILGA
jgi:hypothetical protein